MRHLLEKLKNGQKEQILILILAGVLLLVISLPTEQKQDSAETDVQSEMVSFPLSKREELEQRLQHVLASVSGVGETQVMITVKSDGQKIVEKDVQVSENREDKKSVQAEDDSAVQQNDRTENTVYAKDAQGNEMPYVMETLEPEIEGVLIAAQGAGSYVVINEITEAVMALFGIDAHKIKVMKME